MMEAMANLVAFNYQAAQAASQRSSAVGDQALAMIMAAVALIVLALIVIALLFTRSIVTPLADAVAVAERIASGDLSRPVTATGRDEPALLLHALDHMQRSLRDTLCRITASAEA